MGVERALFGSRLVFSGNNWCRKDDILKLAEIIFHCGLLRLFATEHAASVIVDVGLVRSWDRDRPRLHSALCAAYSQETPISSTAFMPLVCWGVAAPKAMLVQHWELLWAKLRGCGSIVWTLRQRWSHPVRTNSPRTVFDVSVDMGALGSWQKNSWTKF